MTTATAEPSSSQEKPHKKRKDYDPDSFRMTVGEHLEDLRRRLIFALLGFAIAIFTLLGFGQKIAIFFCAPLVKTLLRHHINPQLAYTGLTDPFMTYLKITVISAIALAGPWIIYQLWQFVAAGLYPHERKTVTRYIPLSIALFVTGLVFVYLVVLPLSIEFFIDFSNSFNMPLGFPTTKFVANDHVFQVPALDGDPKDPLPMQIWYNKQQDKLKMFLPAPDGKPEHALVRSLSFGPENLLTPVITLPEYIDLVITFMVTFGVAFQLPLVVLALVSIGIVDVAFLKKQRKIIYFAMSIAAAFLAPGDIVTSMLALLIPLIILYEFGLWLVSIGEKRRQREAAKE
jgi:sec-independent protein translocase protein TatC